MQHTIAAVLQTAIERLLESPSPRLDAEVLLAHVLQVDRSYLRAWPERTLNADQKAQYETYLGARILGEPIAYLIGEREFWSLPFTINNNTLIPRPETELLVELVLEQFPAEQTIELADLGTGSGAIALALASERPQWQITATDIDAASLNLAQRNAEKFSINNVTFIQSDWFQALSTLKFDVIVSNPPYIACDDAHLQQGDLRFEPQRALIAGEDGLDDIRQIIIDARQYLQPEGYLILEHGYQQSADIKQLFRDYGYASCCDYTDYAGQSRVVIAKLAL